MPLAESVWVEIANPKTRNLYWLAASTNFHAGANIDEFKGNRDETMKLFNPNKHQLYVLGDRLF